MRWSRGRRSANIEDRRGSSPAGGGFGIPGAGGLRMPRSRAGKAGGLGGIGFVLLLLIGLFLGVDPSVLLTGGGGMPGQVVEQPVQSGAPPSAQEEQLKDFVSVVLAETEDTWREIFAQYGETYREPTLVLFSDAVNSGCGFTSAQVGPFYCPADSKVYLDLDFFEELRTRFGAPGDFAQAYVVAHEVGHHVQNLLGIAREVDQLRRQVSERDANRLSVMMELQADCFSGVWARHAHEKRNILEKGDIEEGLNAASQIGDDTIQRRSMGRVVPDGFTHGTSEQRMRWFKIGLQEGTLEACNTFEADRL